MNSKLANCNYYNSNFGCHANRGAAQLVSTPSYWIPAGTLLASFGFSKTIRKSRIAFSEIRICSTTGVRFGRFVRPSLTLHRKYRNARMLLHLDGRASELVHHFEIQGIHYIRLSHLGAHPESASQDAQRASECTQLIIGIPKLEFLIVQRWSCLLALPFVSLHLHYVHKCVNVGLQRLHCKCAHLRSPHALSSPLRRGRFSHVLSYVLFSRTSPVYWVNFALHDPNVSLHTGKFTGALASKQLSTFGLLGTFSVIGCRLRWPVTALTLLHSLRRPYELSLLLKG